MEFSVEPSALNPWRLERVKSFIEQMDFYSLNRQFTAKYKIELGKLDPLIDEDGIFIIFSSVLICISKIYSRIPCALHLTDSPPTLIFRPVSDSNVVIQIDSYGNLLGDEIMSMEETIDILKRAACVCRNAIRDIHVEEEDLSRIVSIMNPGFDDLLSVLS